MPNPIRPVPCDRDRMRCGNFHVRREDELQEISTLLAGLLPSAYFPASRAIVAPRCD